MKPFTDQPIMTKQKYHRLRRLKLYKRQDGKCYWCGCLMTLNLKPSGKTPKDFATLDHVFPRGDPRRHDPDAWPRGGSTVLACYLCNNERGAQPVDAFAEKTGVAPP